MFKVSLTAYFHEGCVRRLTLRFIEAAWQPLQTFSWSHKEVSSATGQTWSLVTDGLGPHTVPSSTSQNLCRVCFLFQFLQLTLEGNIYNFTLNLSTQVNQFKCYRHLVTKVWKKKKKKEDILVIGVSLPHLFQDILHVFMQKMLPAFCHSGWNT